ncbi:hypothetical protein SS1G_08246 [Sclerotinia sclerotiorum 1980 UF-70]|uniref:Uncharacterized protein n=1 Tax=Sclerotinia sclerotiorum (strain ATCC 18683 / 1980 / Ss-1) TaxID=665079 RepID=A7ESE1_SCLS1|nr:hypothetical protein SS1G_08246 [Sclerotinia sclerotiorum 1980 UF-70]EDN92383.1 hypothetical protein SS1G_08246 [Sclerotinia sclerotiorum 1980 UF-70]
MAPNTGGGRQYTRDELLFLRDSPLVVKPAGLLSTAEWMGDRDANPLLEHTNRRARNNANPENIQLVPTRTTFSSANPARNAIKGIDSPDRPALRESESQSKLSYRTKIDDSDDRPRRDMLRPKPGDGVDPEGWMEVKPRKSFGTEGAERFTGRMGGERHREEKRFKDRDDRDAKERPRGFENFSRDKDKNHEQENNRRTANGRGRTEPSWLRENNDGPPTSRERIANAERFDNRHKSWREKDSDNRGDRDKGDRRWADRDRDHDDNNRSLPEWAAEDKTIQISQRNDHQKSQISTANNSRKHTAEDMQKWKEAMHSKNKPGVSDTVVEEVTQPKVDEHTPFPDVQKAKILAPLDTGTNEDGFFRLWAPPNNDTGLASQFEVGTEHMVKSAVSAAPGGKTSRFNKFFQQEEPSRKVEPQTAIPKASYRLESLNNNAQSPADKEAMPMILAMLQSSGTPPANPMMQSKPPSQEKQPGTPFEGRDPTLQHLPDRHDELRSNAHSYAHNLHDLSAQREQAGSQPTVRPEEMLHHLVNQRQHAISQSSFRGEQPRSEQTAFLMSLMRDAQAAPEPQRTEQIILGHPPRQQPSRQLQHQQQQLEREQELQAQRERGNPQRRPPGFFDEPIYRGGPPPQHDNSRPQPTHILPRPPPGLEQLQQGWPGQPSSQHPPPQQFRPAAPPGLAGNVPRPMQMPQQILPPGFQMAGSMNNFPPPEALAGPRNMPFNPAYFNGPPPGFLPPVMSPFSAEGMPAFPFDARGPPPPQGAYRRQ